jgi:hypothetical protein
VVGLVLFCGVGAGQSDSIADLATPPPGTKAPKAARPAAKAPPPPPAPVLTGPAYSVKLVRPVKVGDRYTYVADAMVVNSMTANVSGRTHTIRPRNVSIHFEAVEQVLALSDTGEPSKATYTVTRCTKRDGKTESPLVNRGQVLTVTAGKWRPRIDIDSNDMTIENELLLRVVVPLPRLRGITADDCYGTAAPRQVGATWPVNADALARLISNREAVSIKKKDVSGTVRLSNMKEVDGIPHLLVNGKAAVEHWTPDPTDVPEGAKFLSGTAEIKFTKLVPVDPSGHCLSDSFSEKVLMKVTTSDERIGPDVLVDARMLKSCGIKRTPVEVAPVAHAE